MTSLRTIRCFAPSRLTAFGQVVHWGARLPLPKVTARVPYAYYTHTNIVVVSCGRIHNIVVARATGVSSAEALTEEFESDGAKVIILSQNIILINNYY